VKSVHTKARVVQYSDKAPSTEVAAGEYPFMVRQKSGKIVPVVQAYAFTKYLGKLMVVFDDHGNVTSASGNPQLLDSSILEGTYRHRRPRWSYFV
jgi:5'-nucleotidase